MANKKLKLVDNWKKSPKWASMWWSGAGLVVSTLDFLNEVWVSLDHHTQERVPYAAALGMVLFAGTMLGRLLIWTHEKSEDSNDANSN